MLPAYTLVRFSDVHLEDRTKPSGDYIQALLSVQSAYIRLCQDVSGLTFALEWRELYLEDLSFGQHNH